MLKSFLRTIPIVFSLLLFALVSCEEDHFDYLDDDDFTFCIDDQWCYQPSEGSLSGRYCECQFKYQDQCSSYKLSLRFDRDVADFNNGQDVTEYVHIAELRDILTVYLGTLSYNVQSGKIIYKRVSNTKFELVFEDVSVRAEMTDIAGVESHHTYHLKGKLVYKIE